MFALFDGAFFGGALFHFLRPTVLFSLFLCEARLTDLIDSIIDYCAKKRLKLLQIVFSEIQAENHEEIEVVV